MARTELRCDALRKLDATNLSEMQLGKCGKLLARSPELGERVQFLQPAELSGVVWLVDYHRHLACVHVDTCDGIKLEPSRVASETVAWTALRPCNGEPVR